MVCGNVVGVGGSGYDLVNDSPYCGSGYNDAGGGGFYGDHDFCSGYA